MILLPSLEEIKDYLMIDFEDEVTDRTLERLKRTADVYLKGMIGEDYPADDERAKQVALLVIEDLYDNRGMNDRTSTNRRKMIEDFVLQLKLELRRKKDDSSNNDSEV